MAIEKKQGILRGIFLISILVIACSIGEFIEALIGSPMHFVMGIKLLAVGILILLVGFLELNCNFRKLKNEPEKAKKVENLDKLYEKDGWESYGGGLHQYRPHNRI